jgi:formylglycine-generating enzyme required for sulfatase activity
MESDSDGVPDYRDKCPHNRSEELAQGVYERGCPIDRDQDSVADYRDSCLGTSAGVKVKENGCSVPSPTLSSTAKLFRDRLEDGSLGPKMVRIPAGSFRMGDIQGGGDYDEKPVHRVSISRFAMSRTEVTVGEFRHFVNATGYKTEAEKGEGCYTYKDGSWNNRRNANWRNPNFSQDDNHPVVCVSWNDATAYAEWLSDQTGKQYRLPTEAEWEYAARAGTETKYWWGNEIGKNRAACDGCGAKWGWDAKKMTAPVGSFDANQFGLHDTVGNVWEWTCSKYEDKYGGEEKLCTSKKSDSLRVLRGGAWFNIPGYVRVTNRYVYSDDSRDDTVGFRLSRL